MGADLSSICRGAAIVERGIIRQAMGRKLEEIRQYWNQRAQGYALSNQEELEGESRRYWERQLRQALDGKGYQKVLDIGCGPGFFSVLLAQMGYEVTAVDYTENMLQEAKKHAAFYGVDVNFCRMDAQKLEFADASFDFVVSRNVLWNLEEPKQAYKEWFRVLKKGGSLMNCDGNFYYYVKDADYGDRHRWEHRHMEGVCANPIDQIGESLPMAKTFRPQWDMKTLEALGAAKVDGKVTNTQTLDNGHQLVLNFIIQAVK
jgi:ubiquinone/menaquinone biosynthesis C-methylase UbiE